MLNITTSSLWERHVDDPDGTPAWLGSFLADEERLVLVATATPTGEYGWYESANPSFVFDVATAHEILAMDPDDGFALLLSRVSPEARQFGAPFYV